MKPHSRNPVLLAVVLVVFPGVAWPDAASTRDVAAKPTAVAVQEGAAVSRAALHRIFDDHWEATMRDEPTWASELGDHRWDDRWPDVSPAAHEARDRRDREALARLARVSPDALSAEDNLNRDLFERKLNEDVVERGFRTHLMPLSQRGGIQSAHELWESLRLAKPEDWNNWLARLRGVGGHVDETIALMRLGMRTGMMPPKVVMDRVPAQVAKQVVDDPEKSPFFAAFADLSEEMPAEERQRLRREASAAIRDTIVPAYRRFQRFFEDEYLPACRAGVAAKDLPEGAALYAFRVKRFTTTELTPSQVHDLGLSEVARIRREMDDVIVKVGFKGTFQEFLTFLRTDPRFFAKTGEELLDVYRAASKKIDPELVKLFGKLPRMPYGVRPIPPELAPDTTTAYYNGPAADGSRAGTYYVNLYRPEVRPLHEVEALTLHEAVPGHHLQIALAQELGELPKFRRYEGYTAFVEGWGLYAESLGEELGCYEDPYSKFGQLTYEMWRACRLVVDTGIHAFGWERQRAIDFMTDNMAKSEHDIVNEVDRYISWPGQALAYKIGELRIRELRRRATTELGADFDIRAFHDVVLGSGAVPLDALERNVAAFIEARRQRAGR